MTPGKGGSSKVQYNFYQLCNYKVDLVLDFRIGREFKVQYSFHQPCYYKVDLVVDSRKGREFQGTVQLLSTLQLKGGPGP